jgi:hypothetical protein
MVPCSFTQIVETGRQRQRSLLSDAAETRAGLAAAHGRRSPSHALDHRHPTVPRGLARRVLLLGRTAAVGAGLRPSRVG